MSTCRCFDLPPDLRAEYDLAFNWATQWIRYEDADAIDDELEAVETRLAMSLTPIQQAAAWGALDAIKQQTGDIPPCACRTKGTSQ
jgi:hypothetical protein